MEKHAPLCPACLDQFSLIPKEGRCSKCFGLISQVQGVCKDCRLISHPYKRLGSCFDGYGPARSFLRAFSKQGYSHLAKDIAAYLIIQLDALDFPKFDLITYVPHLLSNPHKTICLELSNMLNIPCVSILKRALSIKPTFSLKKKCNIINQTVLLFDIEMDCTVMRHAALTLDRGWTENIYALSFCTT